MAACLFIFPRTLALASLTVSKLEAGDLEIQILHAQHNPLTGHKFPGARHGPSHRVCPPAAFQSLSDPSLTALLPRKLDPRQPPSPSPDLLARCPAARQAQTPHAVTQAQRRGFGTTQYACADRPARLKEEGGEGAPRLWNWTAAGKGHYVRSDLGFRGYIGTLGERPTTAGCCLLA